jgi:hypothetical protein
MPAADEAAQLRAALASRPTIDLAKGVVMAARRCDQHAAFAELARVSMSCNIKVVLLAAVLLERVVLPATGSSQQALLPAAARAAVDRWVQSLPVP